RYDAIRRLEPELRKPLGILMDLQGPKLRVGKLKGGAVTLQDGQAFRLDLDPAEGDEERVNLPHPEIFAAIEAGHRLLIDDGRLHLTVEEAAADHALCRVEIGGKLSDRKGVNVPGTVLPLSPLTEKDRSDLAFGLNLGVDWVALSFVQRPEDLAEARR